MTSNTNIINNQSSASPLTNVDATIVDINSEAIARNATNATNATTTIKPEKTGSTCCGFCDSPNSTS